MLQSPLARGGGQALRAEAFASGQGVDKPDFGGLMVMRVDDDEAAVAVLLDRFFDGRERA